MIRPARRTLAWRLYVLGLVQLVVLGASVVGVGYLIHASRQQDISQSRVHDGPPSEPPPLWDSHGPPDGPPGPPGPPPSEIHRGPPHPPHEPPGGGHHPPSLFGGPLMTMFFSGLVIVGIGAFLTARWIVRPLETLSQAARALGSGDLRVRTGLQRDDELGDVGRAFDDMAERLQRLRGAERELLANVSHELRTPLARIRVALDIAGEGDAEAGRLSITEIGVDLEELESLINDILTAARLELAEGASSSGGVPSSGFELHAEPIAPSTLCDQSAERLRARHPLRPLSVQVDPGLSLVFADKILFRRVLDNLLENAHKYSPIPDSSITLRATPHPTGVAFEVEDHGLGIQAEDLPRVFEPFFRGEKSRSRGTGGVGLGLTLAKRIVEAHKGTIEVTSTAGEGTKVRVVLPARAA